MSIHKIESDENTLHGFFSRDLPPVLTIASGDIVHFRTLEGEWASENFTAITFDTRVDPVLQPKATTKVEGHRGDALCGHWRVLFSPRMLC